MLHVTIRKCRFRHKAGTIWHNKLMRSGEKVYGLFNDSFPPVLDGVTLTVQNYVKKLVESGRKTCVVTPWNPVQEPYDWFFAVQVFFPANIFPASVPVWVPETGSVYMA